MEHIKDLKRLRDDALNRLQSHPDYRTLRALTTLIDDLTLMDPVDAHNPLDNLPGVKLDEKEKDQASAGQSNGKMPNRGPAAAINSPASN
jgi:hypothetical protein